MAFGDQRCRLQRVTLRPRLACPGLVQAWRQALVEAGFPQPLGWHFLSGVLSSDQRPLSLCPSPRESSSRHQGALKPQARPSSASGILTVSSEPIP